MKHVLITAGGTGGHVFPALAVAELLRNQGWQVSWLGTSDRMEAQVVPAAGFDFTGVAQQGVRGRGLKGWLIAPFRLVRSVFRMRNFLAQKKPDLVLGFGGYTAGPAGVAAWTKGIPLVIHEQNAATGLTNKLLARIATKVLVGFNAAQQQLPSSEFVGNPVRSDIALLATKPVSTPTAPFKVLVVGGSLGAEHLNQVVPVAVAALDGVDIEVWHQTGRGKQAEVVAAYANDAKVRVTEFIDDMAQAYEQADLIVCRAGALTCSEIACVGRASILVPYPHAVDNHQLLNAQALAAVGAAKVIEQHDLTGPRLHKELQALLSQPELLLQMAEQARQAAVSNAGQVVVNICNELISGKQ